MSEGLLRRLNITCGITNKSELIFLYESMVTVESQSRNNILVRIKENLKELTIMGEKIVEVEKLKKTTIFELKNMKKHNRY